MKIKPIFQPTIKFFSNHSMLYDYPVVNSTNEVLKKWHEQVFLPGQQCPPILKSVVTGDWDDAFSPPADTGLYLSILYRNEDFLEDPLTLTVQAAVAVAQAIEDVLGINTSIKWVNDLYYEGKKCAGLLAEGIIHHNRLEAIILGIGINLWDPPQGFPDDIAQIACSLLGHRPVDLKLRQQFLTTLYHHLYPLPTGSDIMNKYRKRSMVIGKTVRLTGAGIAPTMGKVENIRNDGALILLTKDEQLTIRSGEITLRLTD